MSEMEEINDKIKESGAKQKRKIGKRGRIIVISSITVIAILIGAIFYVTLTSPPEKYWKPDKEFTMPNVDWSSVKNNYTVKRTHYNDINGTVINQTIGSEKSNGKFRVELVVNIQDYTYRPKNFDIIGTIFYLSFTKMSGDYRVKELVFHYEFGDDKLSTNGLDYYYAATKNLYFTADEGNYHGYTYRINYEWWVLQELRGINKDAKDIKDGGFCNDFQINLFDSYPHWTNHTITMSATLYYGHPSLLGWQDVHSLSTSVVIYVVPEGGE